MTTKEAIIAKQTDVMMTNIESLCLTLLLHQQPVARDLRLVSTALKMITDMERIGDQAADISEICVYLSEQEYIKDLEHIPQMARAVIKMVSESIDAYVRKYLTLAKSVIQYDDAASCFSCVSGQYGYSPNRRNNLFDA